MIIQKEIIGYVYRKDLIINNKYIIFEGLNDCIIYDHINDIEICRIKKEMDSLNNFTQISIINNKFMFSIFEK